MIGETGTVPTSSMVLATDLHGDLRDILVIVDGHLKFAETKNAALFAADATLSVAVAQLLGGDHPAKGPLAYYLIWAISLLVISATIALVSFLPRTNRPFLRRRDSITQQDNLLFFGDIQSHNEASYFQAFLQSRSFDNRDPTDLERMYANQIVINARLAAAKFTWFRYAGWITLYAALTPFLAVPLALWLLDRDPAAK